MVNRSQSDISSGVGMPAARDAERRWFDSHKETYGADTHNVGTDVLCKMLVDILGAAVRFQSTPRGNPLVIMSASCSFVLTYLMKMPGSVFLLSKTQSISMRCVLGT